MLNISNNLLDIFGHVKASCGMFSRGTRRCWARSRVRRLWWPWQTFDTPPDVRHLRAMAAWPWLWDGFREYLCDISMIFLWYFHGISMIFLWYFDGITMGFGSFSWLVGGWYTYHPLWKMMDFVSRDDDSSQYDGKVIIQSCSKAPGISWTRWNILMESL